MELTIPNNAVVYGKYAGMKIPMTLNSAGDLTSTSVKDAIDSLPQNVATSLYSELGLTSKEMGANLTSRLDNLLPFLQDQKGDVSKLNVPYIEQLLVNTDQAKAVAFYKNQLVKGDQPVLLGGTQSAQYTAIANADNYLQMWGIDTPEMNTLVNNLATKVGMTNVNEIMNNIRQTQTYKTAFAGLAEYNSKPGHVHMTENEYRTYSQSVAGAAQQYGNFTPTQAQIGKLLMGNVTAPEFTQRVSDIASAVQNSDPQVKELLKKEFGVDTHHLFAWYANPKETLPDLQRAVATADVQDYASRVGLGGITFKGATQLADMAKLSATQSNQGLGYGIAQVESGVQNAARDVSLTRSLPGANTPTVNTNTLLASQLAGFGGINQVAAETQVARAEQAKTAPFEKGGGYAESAKGIVGLGSART